MGRSDHLIHNEGLKVKNQVQHRLTVKEYKADVQIVTPARPMRVAPSPTTTTHFRRPWARSRSGAGGQQSAEQGQRAGQEASQEAGHGAGDHRQGHCRKSVDSSREGALLACLKSLREPHSCCSREQITVFVRAFSCSREQIGWRKQIRSCEQNGSCEQSGSCEQNGSRFSEIARTSTLARASRLVLARATGHSFICSREPLDSREQTESPREQTDISREH